MKQLQSGYVMRPLVLQQAAWKWCPSVFLWGGNLSPHPLGVQCHAKAALKQSCYLFSLMMPFLLGLFHVALPSHAEHSVGRSLQGQVETFPEEREIWDRTVNGFLLSHHEHNVSDCCRGEELPLCLDFRCKETGWGLHLNDCCAWPCPLMLLLQASPWNWRWRRQHQESLIMGILCA